MYFYNLIKYNKILNERNNLLKSSKDEEKVKQTIDVWNEQLASVGAYIIRERLKYIAKMKEFIVKIHSFLTNNQEKLDILYSSYDTFDIDEIKSQLLKQLSESFDKDFRLGYTNVGPHRDDLKFYINHTEVKTFASQGQQRTVALSIKLAEVEIFKQVVKEYPVLLLDDVLSELDKDRKNNLLKIINRYQTIITTTEIEPSDDLFIININSGKIVKTDNKS